MKIGWLFGVWLLSLLTTPAVAGVTDAQLGTLHQLVSDWQTDEVREQIDPLLKAEPGHPGLRFVEARLLFFEGEYTQSVARLDTLIRELGENAPPSITAFRSLVAKTGDTLKPFDEFTTEDGRFLIRYTGRDKAILPYLIDVLQATDKVLAEDFKYRPKGRVLVEIYPEIKYLAAVSSLTETDIETSGTIALCKYNRLMFTSPRALVRGYGWQDTVAHEFVHYYVTKVSQNTVPIWLHEGIAKFEESRWRAEPGVPLDPPQEDLLARSLKADKLVTFQQMHPSMAKLPSQEAAGLAFAEVHTVVDHLHRRKGYDGLNKLLANLKAGKEMSPALRSVYGVSLDGLWNQWKSALKKKGLKTYPGLVQQSLEFRRPGDPKADEDKEASYGSIEEKAVRDFAHLGELLRARKRPKAALKEYRKAINLGGDGNPMIQNGAASSLLELGQYQTIPELLERVKSYYPGFVRTHLNLGQAYLKLGKTTEAMEAFEAVIGINPFHPLPYMALPKLYETSGKQALADRARKTLELLK